MKTWSDKITQAVGSVASLVVHTLIFIVAFLLPFFGVSFDRVLLVLTTIVSLEAIYLALFIQMTVNRNTESLEDIEEDIEGVQEDIGEITEDLGEVQEDLVEIQEEDAEDETHDKQVAGALENIQNDLSRIMGEVEQLKGKKY